LAETLTTISKHYQDYVTQVRRHLHQYPELGWQEKKTLSFLQNEVSQIVKKSRFSWSIEEKKGGLVVDITHNPTYDTILLRADIDALPIQEETGLSFTSKHPGIMHACGHDCHAAILLGALKAICEHTLPLQHNLRFVWQRAEENLLTDSGAAALIQEGVLKNIAKVYGLHITSKEDLGCFVSRPGPLMSNSTHIRFKIKCLGGHVMNPDKGSNAIDIMTDIHSHLRGLILSLLGPKEPVSFVPSVSHAGMAPNIMPSQAYAIYSFRNFLSLEKRNRFIHQLKERVLSLIRLYADASLESFECCPGYPILENHPDDYELSRQMLLDNGCHVATTRLMFSGEDFSYYLQKCPGCFWLLGAAQGACYDHHTSFFSPSEEVFWQGVLFWLTLATSA